LSCSTAPAAPFDALAAADREFVATYAAARAVQFDAFAPMVVVGFEAVDLVAAPGQPAEHADYTPALYHRYKEVAHVPFTVHLLQTAGRDAAARTRMAAEYLALLQRATADLANCGFPADDLPRQQAILAASIRMLAPCAVGTPPTPAEFDAFTRAMAPLLLANAAVAAGLQLAQLDRIVRPWYGRLTAEQRARLMVVINGTKMARRQYCQVQYFEWLLGEPEGRRILFAENTFSPAAARTILATAITDRRAAVAFFADELFLDRDVLAAGAATWIRDHLGEVPR
jgi:hypothetical protein